MWLAPEPWNLVQDVDAAWGDAGLGDVDDWSHFLEVPDLGFLDAAPDDDGPDGLFSGGFPTTPAAHPTTPGCPLPIAAEICISR